ncbi:MAG: Sua5/YciO/YrdC/YwlC family protein, partial [Acidobacteriaceae bacterium]|nr:Sua5/YciO/YrdC/YwlC family protein [Acidobacteriaceae bacterium]
LFARGRFQALVMTSANLSEEPICIDNDEALSRLHGLADVFLIHNRDILLRCDDSVARSIAGRATLLRRSRGYVPVPIALERNLPAVLAVGGELKNAICITKGSSAFLGQHVGDLENLSAFEFFQESVAHLENILKVRPEAIAYDLHPGYMSTQWALQQQDIRTIGVQHHHAHIASCMAENHVTDPVIGIVLDGSGYGTDGHVWGGEVLVADFGSFRRAAHLEYVPMPGGAQAIREPWRMAVAYLLHADSLDTGRGFLGAIPDKNIAVVEQMVQQQIRSPLTSSCGRLFDAVAALTGLRNEVNYEGQAAIELEACCGADEEEREYSFSLRRDECIEIGTSSLIQQILEDLCQGVSSATISRRFHQGLATVLAEVAGEIAESMGIRTVCLSGGCFLNQRLLEFLHTRLAQKNLTVLTHSQVPPGDGGLSLGQAMIAVQNLS